MAKLHICSLTKDQDVMEGLHDYMKGRNWKEGGCILAGIGSIYDVTLGNPGSYDLKVLHKKKIEAPCEVVSFIGEITCKDKASKDLPQAIFDAAKSDYIIHIHMSCSHGENAIVSGGSLREAKVLRALSVFIFEHE